MTSSRSGTRGTLPDGVDTRSSGVGAASCGDGTSTTPISSAIDASLPMSARPGGGVTGPIGRPAITGAGFAGAGAGAAMRDAPGHSSSTARIADSSGNASVAKRPVSRSSRTHWRNDRFRHADQREHRRRHAPVLFEQPVVDALDAPRELAELGEADHPAAALQRVELRRTVTSASRSAGECSSTRRCSATVSSTSSASVR